jgi:hypothetical protein
MRIGISISLCVFVLGLTPPLIRCQSAAEFRDRPHDGAAVGY